TVTRVTPPVTPVTPVTSDTSITPVTIRGGDIEEGEASFELESGPASPETVQQFPVTPVTTTFSPVAELSNGQAGAQILADLPQKGVKVRLGENQQVLAGPTAALDESDRALLTEHRDSVVAALEEET